MLKRYEITTYPTIIFKSQSYITLEVGERKAFPKTFTNLKSMRQAEGFWPIYIIKIGFLAEKN